MNPDDLTPLLSSLPRALAGDIDAVDEVFTDDVEFHDRTGGDDLDGIDEVRENLAEFAGRRAIAEILEIMADQDRAAVQYVVRFQADAHHYAQRGTAWVDLEAGRISRWDSVWIETTEDSSWWDES